MFVGRLEIMIDNILYVWFFIFFVLVGFFFGIWIYYKFVFFCLDLDYIFKEVFVFNLFKKFFGIFVSFF